MSDRKKTERDVMNAKANRVMRGVNTWCSFYRANPHRFCKDYLNINLKPFQQILIVMMNICHYVMYIAARGRWPLLSEMITIKWAKSVKASLLIPR